MSGKDRFEDGEMIEGVQVVLNLMCITCLHQKSFDKLWCCSSAPSLAVEFLEESSRKEQN